MFHHTQNENGSYNSRCLYCFFTVASAVENEARRDQLEAGHLCPERAMADLQAERQNDSDAPAS
jgi:hypothetical protein